MIEETFPDDVELQEIARKYSLGDPQALERILEFFGPVVSAKLTRSFGASLSHEDVEDVLGLALYKLWGARHRYDASRPLFPWFYLIARNVALDHLRGKQRQPMWLRLSHALPQVPDRGSSPSSSALLQRLQEILQSLPEQDRAILLNFAGSEDSGNWATETAAWLGKTPNYVRVRKKRLLEQLQELFASPFPVTGSEEAPPMDHVQHLVEVWNRFRPQFREMMARLHEAHSQAASQEPSHPAQVLARAWNASREDGSLQDEQYRRILQRAHSWIQGLLRHSQDCRKELSDFAQQCRSDDRLRGATLYRDSREILEERLMRAVGGLAQSLEERMPDSVRSEQRGHLEVKWSESGTWLDGSAAWQSRDANEGLTLMPVARASLRLYAELPASESEVFADRLLSAVRAGQVSLPDFTRRKGDKQWTLFEWFPEGVRPIPAEEAPKLEDREYLPFPLELDLWEKYPEAAQAVDEVLMRAALEDNKRARQSQPETSDDGDPVTVSEVEQVIRALRELTGYPVEEVVLLLTARLEWRVQKECESDSCDAYQRALDFLASHLSPP